jgi:hypothetical protein
MDDEQRQEGHNPLVGGIDNVNNNMIKTMFELSAFKSDNDKQDGIESDDDKSGLLLCGRKSPRCELRRLDIPQRSWVTRSFYLY